MSRFGIEPADVGIGRLFDSVRDAVVVADASTGRIVLWNLSAEGLFGYARDEAVGQSLEILIPEDLRPLHRAGIARYAATRTGPLISSSETVRLRAMCKDGDEIDVELTLSPLDDAAEHGLLVVAIIRDVSARVRLEPDLTSTNDRLAKSLASEQEATKKLQEISDLKSDSVAMVAHDLKAPLTNIAELTSLLRSAWDRVDGEQRVDVLRRIEANVERQLRLIDDVLQVERLEAGHLEYRIAPFDLHGVAVQVADEASDVEGVRQVLVRKDAHLPLALGDERRHRQVLVNLVSNAQKFSSPDEPVEVTVRQAGDFLRVDVTDHGTGIAPDDLPRLFKKFSRVGSAAEGPRGTGLGLYICKRMIEDLGGEISVSSALGQGTTMSFTVPTAPSGAPTG